jgi:protein required for attachment to host cells
MNTGPIWIVVADGAQARLFEQLRPGAAVIERESFARRAAPAAQSRDRLSRMHDRTGPARHAIEPRETPHEAAEHAFLDEVGEEVARLALARAFRRLVLCAPPKAMGELRRRLPRKLRAETGAVLKDIVNRPQAEIIALLQTELSALPD